MNKMKDYLDEQDRREMNIEIEELLRDSGFRGMSSDHFPRLCI